MLSIVLNTTLFCLIFFPCYDTIGFRRSSPKTTTMEKIKYLLSLWSKSKGHELLVIPGNHIMSPVDYLPTALIQLTVTACLCVVALLANTYVAALLARSKISKSFKNDCYGYYLLHLFVADIFMAILSIPFTVVYNRLCWDQYVFALYRLAFMLKVFLGALCIATPAAMVLQRLRGVNKSLRKKSSMQNFKWSLAFVWVWSLCLTLPIHYIHESKTQSNNTNTQFNPIRYAAFNNRVYFSGFLCCSFAIPVVVTFFCCILLSRLSNVESALMMKRSKQYKTFAAMTLLFTLTYIGCTLPEYLLQDGRATSEDGMTTLSSMLTLSWLFTAVHPLIYYVKFIKPMLNEKRHAKDERINSIRRSSNLYDHSRKDFSTILNFYPDRERRLSIFQRRSSAVSDIPDIDIVLQKYWRRSSHRYEGTDFQTLNSCMTHLEHLNRLAQRKVTIGDRIRRFRRYGRRDSVNERELSDDDTQEISSLLILPYPHIVHKLNQNPL